MYHEFYRLNEHPFNVTADPDFFFSSKGHSDAISNLEYGIESRKGILVVTGEIGTGKTTLCRKLLKQADSSVKFALILNPNFSELQLLQMIINDLGIKTKQKNKFGLVQALNEFLLVESNKGNNVVLIIDEAQNLSVNQLEQIRLLSNLETEKEKLLQIILVGQPELYDKLQLVKLRQLRQRVAVHYHLQPLQMTDIKHYIQHRLAKAAQQAYPNEHIVFTAQAIDAIYQHTKGSPRSINILCDRALLAGFVAETYSIDETIIESCTQEVVVS
ncbi:MAG: AAA family ATPase [Gammaproteobacteria bacterium]|nr:AAA family ATPase [Gammaproteobacteria bacterium]